MAPDGVDLGALQQQLQQQRSALAGQILSHLPKEEKPKGPAPTPASSAPRPARLGVGAEGAHKPQLSAADQRLRSQLSSKKRQPEQPVVQNDDDDDEQDTKGSSVAGKGRRAVDPFAAAAAKAPPPQPPQDAPLSKAQKKKLNKRRRLEEDAASDASSAPAAPTKHTEPKVSEENVPTPTASVQPESSGNGLTALQSSMLTSLKGARFRSINERLYTSNSSDALELMRSEPQVFDEYHDGFRQQVRKWPRNPVDVIASLFRGKGKKGRSVRAGHPGALVVDLGAGEAGLARQLVPAGVHVLSYDLVDSADGWVRGVDAARLNALPLPGTHEPMGVRWSDAQNGAVVDAAVFCLSLMGTNWLEMIIEARRVLRENGELVIAEVTSRFGPEGAGSFTGLVRSVGFELDWEDTTDNTHFALFKFTKRSRYTHSQSTDSYAGGHASIGDAAAEEGRLVQEGCAVLRPCLYKRR